MNTQQAQDLVARLKASHGGHTCAAIDAIESLLVERAMLLEALKELAKEYEPNLKTFGDNAPRKSLWEAALAAIAQCGGNP
jgi:gamma-glutamyl phosphate reductase